MTDNHPFAGFVQDWFVRDLPFQSCVRLVDILLSEVGHQSLCGCCLIQLRRVWKYCIGLALPFCRPGRSNVPLGVYRFLMQFEALKTQRISSNWLSHSSTPFILTRENKNECLPDSPALTSTSQWSATMKQQLSHWPLLEGALNYVFIIFFHYRDQ